VKEGLNDSDISTAEYSEEIVLTGNGLVDDPYQIENCRQLQRGSTTQRDCAMGSTSQTVLQSALNIACSKK
jgi:hypothetical protein